MWFGGSAGVEQIAVLEAGWNDPTSQTSGMVRGRPVETARALMAALQESGRGSEVRSWAQSWLRAQDAVAITLANALSDALSEPGLHRALGKRYREEEIVYTASSMPIRDQEFFLPPIESAPLFVANRGANGIDGLVSSGIGAAIASGRPTWIVTGDLGFVHDSNGLMTLKEARQPVRIVIVNNNGGAIFEHLPQAEVLERDEFERLFITPSGVDLMALCAAHSVDYVRIDSLGQLEDTPPGSCVLEVPTAGSADAELRRRIAELTRDALVDALSIT
jgi:2-succinyl-5-enolpyruvyl-6-hydroxy-3-cyclohexene-1-carboxylate synthase